MISGKRTLNFIHRGKAIYPELRAYKSFFDPWFHCNEVSTSAQQRALDTKDSICWYLMGFYPMPSQAAFTIHDYRSMSLGSARFLKDVIKRHFNAKPSLRIFHNEETRDAFGFQDDIACCILEPGIPDFAINYRGPIANNWLYDFCYIGAISKDRNIEIMLDSFLSRFGGKKSFVLIGNRDKSIEKKYEQQSNIKFNGFVQQEELFSIIKKTRCAVNYIPEHYPFTIQPAVKLREYAGLGLRILANEQICTRQTVEAYGINCLWGGRDVFANCPDELDWPDNSHIDPSIFSWSNQIRHSGVEAYLKPYMT